MRFLSSLGCALAFASALTAAAPGSAQTFGIEDATCPVKPQSSPRQVAGGPRSETIYKCQRKALDFADAEYGGVEVGDAQKSRLLAIFPDGICNFNLPGDGQVAANPWTTFAAGPGGRPLSPPAVSVPVR